MRLPKATVHRLVTVLVTRGFLERDPATTQYRIGLTLFRLGNLFLAQAHIRQAVCIEKTESTHDIHHAVELGRPLPLYAGASGKVLLVYLPDEEIRGAISPRSGAGATR